MSNPTPHLIALRHHYQNIVAQSEYQAAQAKMQLDHIDALLLNGLLQEETPTLNAVIAPALPALAAAPASVPELIAQPTPIVLAPQPKAPAKKAKAAAASLRRESLTLLLAYEGMTKLEAIAKVLTEQSGHVLHQDTIIQLLYGDLSPEELNLERRRMRASLFQGVKKGLWQRAPKHPSSYLVKASKGRKPKTAEENDHPVPVVNEVEVTRPATQVAPALLPAKAGRKPSTSGKARAAKAADSAKSASRGREQVLSLPAEYEGLSKIDTVAKVLGEHPGTVVHIDDIIKRLYGELTGDGLKAEKDRMKDVMTRGIKRELWIRAAGIPSSYVIKEPSQPTVKAEAPSPTAEPEPKIATEVALSKSPGRKPKPSPAQKSTAKQSSRRRRRSSAVE